VVRDGRIAAVGAPDATPAPDGAETLAGEGRFLMPGLWDMHVHVGGTNDGLLHIASGVTTVRDLANDKEALDAKIAGYERGDDIGPRVVRAGFVDGRGPFAGPTKVFVDTEAEARAAVEQFAKDGFVQLKIYSSIKPELVPLLIRLAHEKGLRVSGHVPQGLSARKFVEAGADELQHANFLFLNFLADSSVDTRTPQRFVVVADRAVEVPLDGEPMQDFIALLREHHTVIDPTLMTFEGMFLDRPGKMGPTYFATVGRMPANWQRGVRAATGGLAVTPATDTVHRESYRRVIDLVGLMYRSGVTVVAGTDAFPLFALARELELYVQAGIPPAEALRIATLGAARVMKRDQEYGKVAPGYVADLVLIDGDPTKLITDVRRVRTVVRGDRWYDAQALYDSVGIGRDD
ncbi:MAG TPA: amidohydrolase family protein, partial [Xanthomonadales bacterium]|nr:amidohydrolase family protein [Xanthomonadales bacterium]